MTKSQLEKFIKSHYDKFIKDNLNDEVIQKNLTVLMNKALTDSCRRATGINSWGELDQWATDSNMGRIIQKNASDTASTILKSLFPPDGILHLKKSQQKELKKDILLKFEEAVKEQISYSARIAAQDFIKKTLEQNFNSILKDDEDSDDV